MTPIPRLLHPLARFASSFWQRAAAAAGRPSRPGRLGRARCSKRPLPVGADWQGLGRDEETGLTRNGLTRLPRASALTGCFSQRLKESPAVKAVRLCFPRFVEQARRGCRPSQVGLFLP